MPTYDYHCPANGRVVEVSHKIAEKVATWGELCRKAGIDPHGEGAQVQAELFEALRWDAPPLPATAPIARA